MLLFGLGFEPPSLGQASPSSLDTNWWARSLASTSAVSPRGLTVESFAGRVLHREKDSAAEIEIKERGRRLARGDELATKENSRAVILSVREATAVDQITRLRVVDPRTVEVLAGKVYFKSLGVPDPPTGEAPVQVKTPAGVFEPLGTEFHLTVDAATGRSELISLDGEVRALNSFGVLTNAPGQRAVVSEGAAPQRSPQLEAINNIIQWALYYPAILDPDELPWGPSGPPELSASVGAYRSGNLLQALALYPAGRNAESEAERVYHAALLLGVGQVAEAEQELDALSGVGGASAPGAVQRQAVALGQLIAAVKFQPFARPFAPELASEWLAESYYRQSRTSRTNLASAREAASKAVAKSPRFSFGWARLAELDFSFGENRVAQQHLREALTLGTNNAQAIALNGYLLAAQNHTAQAIEAFRQALEADPGLGNAWLGLGLCDIHRGDMSNGLQHIQMAVASEPQRAFLRSYLGKAYHEAGRPDLALKELSRAVTLDPNDPTPSLYSALIKRQQNQVNAAVRDLESSKELNDNRSVYRSGLLLDQDRAVRGANLAAVYRDAGLQEVSVREASRAVESDYANSSAHLFLAESYDMLRDPRGVTLRYETPWANELLLANLLAPVGANSLSRSISQQEYAPLFERDRMGFYSSSTYFSTGDWLESASQYGTIRNTSYAVDGYYLRQNGQRPNEDQETWQATGSVKEQITPQDSVLAQVLFAGIRAGDLNRSYNQADASRHLRVAERQTPIVLAGFHHEWNPQNHTLVLGAFLDDTLKLADRGVTNVVLIETPAGAVIPSFFPINFAHDYSYQSTLRIGSAEVQHAWQSANGRFSTIVGGRFQFGEFMTEDTLANPAGLPFYPPILYTNPLVRQDVESDFDRESVYAYQNGQVLDSLWLTAGLSYDRIRYPINHRFPPVADAEGTRDQVSPKVGFVWSPGPWTHVRGSYTRSLGGVSFDQSFRLEPNQVAGFIQSYRSLIPESLFGSVAAEGLETYGLAVDHRFPTLTYVGVTGELLESRADQSQGVFAVRSFAPLGPEQVPGRLSYRERTLLVTLNQLLGDEWSAGVRYRLSQSEINQAFEKVPVPASHNSALLHHLNLNLLFNHPSGFFSQFEANWYHQHNQDYTPPLPGDDFWQLNLFVGYRFLQRRMETRFGLLNLTGQDYRLNPLSLYAELSRRRTFVAELRVNF